MSKEKITVMKRFLTFCILMCLEVINCNIHTQAWTKRGAYPSNATTTLYVSSNCPSGGVTPVKNAVSAWNGASPYTFKFVLGNSGKKSSYSAVFSSSTGTLKTDGISTIGTPISAQRMGLIAGSELSVANTHSVRLAVQPTRYAESDIVINSSMTFTSSYSTIYCDYQGVFTHELGHVLGMGESDVYTENPANCPTMYGSIKLPGNNDYIGYHLRTLESDDKAGKLWIGKTLGY